MDAAGRITRLTDMEETDARVTLSMLGHKKTEMGLQEYLVVYGNAYLTEGGAADLLQKLAYSYIGPDVEFPPESVRNQSGFITHIVPQRFAGVGNGNESYVAKVRENSNIFWQSRFSVDERIFSS
jgi:hypothetical protein